MNTIIKKMLLVVSALLSTACVHYPRQYSYYPDNRGYSSGYTIMHRNYYGERPDHYDHDRTYFPNHHQYVPQHWDNDHSGRRQQNRSHDHAFSYENNRQHNRHDDDHNNRFERRNRH